ncbi:MAG TPA: endonuclease/exonuclease/phosphatase family protein [Opitutaceae bacterium]|nr:endonuclease/exonuclease/phosphatase family protein [Opitutaceae bacterium]
MVLPGIDARAETLTVATYNLENYLSTDRLTGSGYRKDYPKPEDEKRALRSVVRALNADVLALQEMGPRAYLEEFRRDLKAEGIDYPHAVLLEAADADRHVALLSKRPLKGVVLHTDLEFAYFEKKETVKRGLLEASVATGGGDITLFVVHLKSRFTDRPDDPLSVARRSAEATAVRDRVLRRFTDPSAARFLIVGDCNDGKPSKTLQHLARRGKTTVAELLPAADSRGENWTHSYRKEESYSRVDHVLVSPGLQPAVEGGAARIYDGPGVREASDHRPVIVTLQTGKR